MKEKQPDLLRRSTAGEAALNPQEEGNRREGHEGAVPGRGAAEPRPGQESSGPQKRQRVAAEWGPAESHEG